MKIAADKYKGYKKEMEEMGMGSMAHCVPVDLYGKRTLTEKSISPTLEEMGEDIKEVYGLDDY